MEAAALPTGAARRMPTQPGAALPAAPVGEHRVVALPLAAPPAGKSLPVSAPADGNDLPPAADALRAAATSQSAAPALLRSGLSAQGPAFPASVWSGDGARAPAEASMPAVTLQRGAVAGTEPAVRGDGVLAAAPAAPPPVGKQTIAALRDGRPAAPPPSAAAEVLPSAAAEAPSLLEAGLAARSNSGPPRAASLPAAPAAGFTAAAAVPQDGPAASPLRSAALSGQQQGRLRLEQALAGETALAPRQNGGVGASLNPRATSPRQGAGSAAMETSPSASTAGEAAWRLPLGAEGLDSRAVTASTAAAAAGEQGNDALRRLIDQAQLIMHRRGTAATLSLKLDDLGGVDVSLRQEAGQTHLSFSVRDAAAREALEAQLPRLRALFDENGLSLGDVAMSFSDRSEDHGEDRPTPSSQAGDAFAADAGADRAQLAARRPQGATSQIIDTHV